MNSSTSFQQCNGLNNLEKHYIQTYTGNLYKPLNLFLLNTDTLQTYHRIYPQELAQNLYYIIINKPNSYTNGTISYDKEERIVRLIRSKSDNIEWFRHIMFNFTILLYGIILKCPRQPQEVEVYRGVLTHYLREDIHMGYFLNTFTSTTTDKQIARSFSKDNNNDIIYHFIVKPNVSCIYIGNSEAEILINPYQLYYFVKKDGAHYFYSIHPSNIILPNNENNFSDFKKEIMVRTVKMEGGKADYRELNYTDTISHRRNTRRSKNNRKNRHTRRANRNQKKLTEREHFIERMKMPIGTSSFGIPLTPEMIADRERVAREYSIYNK